MHHGNFENFSHCGINKRSFSSSSRKMCLSCCFYFLVFFFIVKFSIPSDKMISLSLLHHPQNNKLFQHVQHVAFDNRVRTGTIWFAASSQCKPALWNLQELKVPLRFHKSLQTDKLITHWCERLWRSTFILPNARLNHRFSFLFIQSTCCEDVTSTADSQHQRPQRTRPLVVLQLIIWPSAAQRASTTEPPNRTRHTRRGGRTKRPAVLAKKKHSAVCFSDFHARGIPWRSLPGYIHCNASREEWATVSHR